MSSSIVRISVRSYSKAVDPIQQLFVDKIREYDQKLKANGGALFDPTPELERERSNQYLMLKRQLFKDSNPENLTQFPEFRFEDRPLDDINMEPSKKN
ncbi:ATP synthase-coupling factor 6, mitochondrial-like [Cimex lectularius]|uniref:ATP synthase-coupling factor 6, mitochondrial n=1 Tax=Cimex lectularius TaxID=79782 RepID=A0A8I6SB98_CIMLE|nr:ATP synthase-coupling factor 6, mitochondrial-like [Cimex lectularius]